MSVVCSLHHGDIASTLVAEVVSLSEGIFEPPAIDYSWRLTRMPEVSLVCARQAGVLVGFKAIGSRLEPHGLQVLWSKRLA